MGSKLGGLVLLLASAPAFALGNGTFCVYSNSGLAQCYYYSIDACQMAQRSLGGMCAPNNQPQAQQQIQLAQPAVQRRPTFNEGFQQGAEIMQQAAQTQMERREHDARMQLLQQQLDSQRQQSVSNHPVYSCPSADGRDYFTEQAEPGCTVVGGGFNFEVQRDLG